jgi:hypothetical protein
MICYIILYYDSYEATFGDGLYPLTYRDQSCDTEEEFGFEYKNGYWDQVTGPVIRGYDGDEYSKIISILNACL